MINNPIKIAVFPVAGKGTRMLPATKVVPKELLPILEKPLLQYAIEEAKDAGIEHFVFISSREKPLIEAHLRADQSYVRELIESGKYDLAKTLSDSALASSEYTIVYQDAPRGLGHAVWCAKHIVGNNPFAVVSPDDYILGNSCLKEMVENYQYSIGHNMMAVMPVDRQLTRNYGVITPGEWMGNLIQATHVVEKPDPEFAPSNLAIIGRYILQPAVMEVLDRREVGAGGEIQLTDAFHPNKVGLQLWGSKFSGQRFDCGSREGWFSANLATAVLDPAYRHVLNFMFNQAVA